MALAKCVKGPQGKFLLKGLFFEHCPPDRRDEYCSFTLKDEEHEGYPSMKQLFLGFTDPTEYEFATAVLGSYSHWKQLCSCSWFKPIVAEWREELEVKIRSKAIQQIKDHATGDKGFAASRWLAEKGWEEKKVGAKPKAAKEAEERVKAKISSTLEEDLIRLRQIK